MFKQIRMTENDVLCHVVHRLYQGAPYTLNFRYTRKCNFINDRKKIMTLPVTIFTKMFNKIITNIFCRTSPKLDNKCNKCGQLTPLSKVASTQPIFMKLMNTQLDAHNFRTGFYPSRKKIVNNSATFHFRH